MRTRFLSFRYWQVAWVLAASLWAPLLQAHAILLESIPAVHATVETGKSTVRFRFNSRVDAVRSRLILVRPDRTTQAVALLPQPAPDVLAASIGGLQSGDYVLRWQVLAADGHISRGEVPFKVVLPASGQ